MENKFFEKNRNKLKQLMNNNEMVVLSSGKEKFFSSDQFYPFRVNKNFYYFTGIEEKEIYYTFVKFDGEIRETIFVNRVDPEKAKWIGDGISNQKIIEKIGISDELIHDMSDFKFALNNMIAEFNVHAIYVDYSEKYDMTPQYELQELVERNHLIDYKELSTITSKLRKTKEEYETLCIKKAIDITKEGIESILKNLKNLDYEYEIEALFGYAAKNNGVKAYGFSPIVASGSNAATLHYESNDSKIEKDSLVLLDLGVEYKNYSSDISRTFPASGRFTEKQKLYYNIVLESQKLTIENIKCGMTFKELNDITKKYLADRCIEIGLIKEEKEIENYYYHSVSHPLGLDAHDLRDNEPVITEGMVITVEPGLYIKEEGIGIRIEDDVFVRESDVEILSKDIIKEASEIEEFMNR